MLKEMRIENFILIDKVEIKFDKGFTVISGETGSGKSILIDAMCFILGFKFNKNIVRSGEDKTLVEAVFDIEHIEINKILNENGIETDDYLLIRREGYSNGKSIVRVNGKVVTNNVLKSISKFLMDIHTQHQNYELLNDSKHIHYLDKYIGKELKLDNYLNIYNKWVEIREKIDSLKSKELNESYVEYIKFQIDELNKAKLVNGEDEELEGKLKILNNSEKISKIINGAMEDLKYSEENSIISKLSCMLKSLNSIDYIVEDIKSICERTQNIYYELDNIFDEIKSIGDGVSFDLNEFDSINARIYLLNSLKRKFNKSSSNELILYNEELEMSLDKIVNHERIIEDLKNEESKLYKELCSEAINITSVRCSYSKKIEEEIISELKFMGMENIIFKIDINEDTKFTQLGRDSVNFLISTNKGEPLRLLSKIVSGGELSRIMLALKIVFLGNEPISGIIFDEIDTGVSGKIAQKVGEKMYYLSSKCQVFCITHLPQIASLSDNHYLAVKKNENDKTFTEIRVITKEEKVNEIAKMIGGENITKSAFISAKELIENKKNLE